jgi:hypothetical protein
MSLTSAKAGSFSRGFSGRGVSLEVDDDDEHLVGNDDGKDALEVSKREGKYLGKAAGLDFLNTASVSPGKLQCL